MTTTAPARPTGDTYAILDRLNHNSSPAKDDHQQAVRMATLAAVIKHDGEVTWAWVRPLLPEWVDAALKGSAYSGLINAGLLVDTGRTERSGDTKSRNGNKRCPVYYAPSVAALSAHVHGAVA